MRMCSHAPELRNVKTVTLTRISSLLLICLKLTARFLSDPPLWVYVPYSGNDHHNEPPAVKSNSSLVLFARRKYNLHSFFQYELFGKTVAVAAVREAR